MGDAVVQEVRDHVLLVTLNRPGSLNAVTADVSRGVGQALERADADADIRVVVLCGAGRAFCAGVDLKELAAGRPVHDPEHPEWGFAGITRHRIATPVVAAVHGFALGGGTEIALAADLLIADETALFGLPEVTRGLVAGAGGMLRLPRQVPLKVALEIGLTGAPVPAERAHQLGLVNRVVPAGAAVTEAMALAGQIAAAAPLAVRLTKQTMYAAAEPGPAEDLWERNNTVLSTVMSSADATEGMRAFAEKRSPAWRT